MRSTAIEKDALLGQTHAQLGQPRHKAEKAAAQNTSSDGTTRVECYNHCYPAHRARIAPRSASGPPAGREALRFAAELENARAT